jgi:hypothetical protein
MATGDSTNGSAATSSTVNCALVRKLANACAGFFGAGNSAFFASKRKGFGTKP